MSTRGQPVLRASEVGRYAYCARAWWLQRVRGVEPRNAEARQRGAERHSAHGRGVQRASRMAAWALVLALIAVALLGAWALAALR
ncbi:MAG: hypothetical protein GX557_04900 [Chloroflexi bacterium]|nr:hypothetical protein [Chloroflexota bacterium]